MKQQEQRSQPLSQKRPEVSDADRKGGMESQYVLLHALS
jgi:hypothetical protein